LAVCDDPGVAARTSIAMKIYEFIRINRIRLILAGSLQAIYFFQLYSTIKNDAMPKHNVFFNLPRRELGKTDVVFEIFSDLEKFGTITISKGALEWWPSNAKKPFRMDWTRFDRAIREHYGY